MVAPIPCPRCGKAPVVSIEQTQRLIGHDQQDGASAFCELNVVVLTSFSDREDDVILLWNDVMGGVRRDTSADCQSSEMGVAR